MSYETLTYPGPARDREPLAEVVRRVDLVDLVTSYAGSGRKVGGYWAFPCPHPSHADTHPSFQVRTDQDGTERARCRSGCAWSGDAADLVQWLEGCDTAEAARTLRRYLGESDTGSKVRRMKKAAPRDTVPVEPPPLPDTTYPSPEVAATVMASYLEGRGWPTEVVDGFGLEVVLDQWGQPRIRHPFQVPTSTGLVAPSWQDRATGDRKPKWLAPPGRALPLYNVAALEDDDLAAVVLCEGPADTVTAAVALRADQQIAAVGIAGAEAWRPPWAQLLSGLVVVIATDDDDAGHRLAARMEGDLTGYAVRVEVVTPAEGHNDLTDMGKAMGLEAVGELLRAAARVVPLPPPDDQDDEDDQDDDTDEEWHLAPAADHPPPSLFDPVAVMMNVTSLGLEELAPEVVAMVARMKAAGWPGPMVLPRTERLEVAA